MPILNQIQVLPGLALPFFPMRPKTGPRISKANVLDVIREMSATHNFQRKRNGDRAIRAIVDRKVYTCNRHGSWLKHPTIDEKEYLVFPDLTCFDGEVFKKQFEPFETLAFGGQSFITQTSEDRQANAMNATVEWLGREWMYTPTEEWLMKADDNLPDWEGVVAKEKGCRYRIMGSASQECSEWFRVKWVGTLG